MMSPYGWRQSLWRLRTLPIFLSISILSLLIPIVFPQSAFTNSTDFIELDEYELPEDAGTNNSPDIPDYPPGSTSLTFVFDKTGSMLDDLQKVQEGAIRILEATTRNADTPLYNFVLVPFDDPKVGPVIETRDQDEFLAHLDDLEPQFGGDCPEMSISAIKSALEVSLPGSQIYVFTDARAKDYHKTQEVLALIQKTESQVIFVLTGDCDDSAHEGYQAYEDIAATSSGQVFKLNKSDVGEILKFVELSVQTRKVNLISTDMRQSAVQYHSLPVDTRLQQFTISVSGENPYIMLRDPRGTVVPILPNNPDDPPDGPYLEELLTLGKAYIVAMHNSTPGSYRLNVSSTSSSTLRVQGMSVLDFQYGFTTERNFIYLNDTSRLPLRGVRSQLVIGADQLLPGGYLKKVEFLNMMGHIIPGHEYTLDPHPTVPGVYTVPDIIPPGEYFHIRVKGIDHQNYKFQRITAAAVSPLVPAAPSPRMLARTPAFFGKMATLNCFVESDLPFTVEWRRQEEVIGTTGLISDSSAVQLEVGEAHSGLEDIYSCIAHSRDMDRPLQGRAETYLDVTEPPPSIEPPHNVTVVSGVNAILTCHISSTVPHNVTWDRPGSLQRLRSNHRVNLLRNGSLIIQNIRPSDAGNYRCIARNEGGHNFDVVPLIVHEPPVIYSSTSNVTFMAWENETLSCSATGVPEPRITWTKDDRPLPLDSRIVDDGAGRLILRSMTLDLAGTYRCHVVNDAGAVDHAISVTYFEVPSITRANTDYLVAPDQTAVLPCRASGSPPPVIMWFKDGVNLSSSHYTHITEEGDLVIRSAHVYDRGQYVCVAANDAGSDTMEVTLNVGTEPRIIQAPSRNSGDDYGQNVTLTCIARGDPRPTIRWEKINDGFFSDEGRVRVLPSGHLFIEDLAVDDRGAYICHAENRFGTDTAYTQLRVTGLVQPSISPVSPIETVTADQKLSLQCEVFRGNPPPTVEWYRDGQPMAYEVGRHTLEDDNSLVIERVLLTDTGRYTCIASNEVGNASVTMQLVVQVPPTISEDARQTYTVIQTKMVRMTCPSEGFPRPRTQWFFRGESISSNSLNHYVDDEGALNIPFATGEERGTYTCRVTSSAGSDQLDISLFVLVPPSIDGPDSLTSLTAVEFNPVTLPCVVRSNPPSQIRWSKNGELLPLTGSNYYQTSSGSLNFRRVEESDRGYYVCTASNEAGNTTKSVELEVQVVPRIRDPGTRDVSVNAGETLNMECEAYGNPDPEITWQKDGAPVKLHKRRFSMSAGGTLSIRNARPGDRGSYSCIASNEAGTDRRVYRLSVYTAPNVTEPYQSHSVLINNDVTLYCGASGFPDPEIEWFFNDEPISPNNVKYTIEDSIGSLEIHSTTIEDTGVFQCSATNPAGSATAEIELAVVEPPRVTNDTLQVVRVRMGESTDLVCDIHSIPPPEITWQLDDRPIPSSASVSVLPDDTLRISRARSSDAGYYSCIATNIVGSATKAYQLVVLVPPTIVPGESEETGFVGEAVRLMCDHDGFPVPTVTWMKDDQKVNVGNRRKYIQSRDGDLAIYGLQGEDSGEYTCVVKNVAGVASRTVALDVLMAPTIFDTPNEHTVLYRNSVTLHCESDGIPPPKTVWMKDGAAITDDDIRYYAHPSGTLRIASTVRSDSGVYTCLIANSAGSARKDILLNVIVPPEFNNDAEEEYNIELSEDLSLPCGVDSYPAPDITWTKNDRLLSFTSPRVLIMTDSLDLPRAQVSDSGLYRCFVEHPAGNISRTFRVNVQVPPRIGTSLTTIRALTGEDVILPCEAVGVPLPEVMWTKGGQKYPPRDERIEQMEVGSLSITGAREEDSGKYLCIAVSDAGSDTKVIWLEVSDPPRITTPLPPNIREPLHSLVEILCDAQGSPRPEVTWFKDANPIEQHQIGYTVTTEGTLIISSLQPGDDGVYTCLVYNQWGNDSQSTVVETLVRPHIVGENTRDDAEFVTIMHGKDVQLECNVTDAQPPATIVWWKDNRPIRNPEDHNLEVDYGGRLLTIPFIQNGDIGEYLCIARNDVGDARKYFIVDVQEGPVITSPSWEEVTVMVGEDVRLDCDASGTPEPRISWHFEDIPLSYNNQRYTFHEGSISLRQVEVFDTGFYTCVAKNHAGSVNRTVVLTVQVPPSINPGKQNFAVPKDTNVVLPCDADGVPIPEVTWEKDGEPIDVDKPQYEKLFLGSLRISNIQEESAGTYVCTASNDAGEVSRTVVLQVYTPPTVVPSIPQTTTAPVGGDVVVPCPLSGTPAPRYRWKKNNRPLRLQRRKYRIMEGGQLLVRDATLLDSGEYVCEAINEVGKSSIEVNLQITAEPRIRGTHDSEDYPVQELDSIDLQCFVEEAHPPPTIEWYFQGEVLSENDLDVAITNNGQVLTIDAVSREDAGEYWCVVWNAVGRSRRVWRVDVLVAPTIVSTGDQLVEVLQDRHVRLECYAEGNPAPNITWTKDGAEIYHRDARYRITGRGSLEIANTISQDSGEYACIASSVAGEDVKQYTLEVLVPPVMVGGEDTVSVTAGFPAYLDCQTTGSPPPTITWQRNLRSVTQASASAQQYKNGTLKINSTRLSDSGVYVCHADNTAGDAFKEVELVVNELPHIRPPSDTDRELVKDDELMLDCPVYGSPTPVVTWLKDDQIVDPSMGHVFENGTFYIPAIQPSDSGSYTCLAINVAGNDSITYQVSIHVRPRIVDQENSLDISSYLNEAVTLTCEVSEGTPAPRITWLKDGERIPINAADVRIRNQGKRLSILQADIANSGRYTCRAENIAGRAERFYGLFVMVTPSFGVSPLQEFTNLNLVWNQQLALDCGARGVPPPTITWLKDGVPILPELLANVTTDGQWLIVDNVQEDHTGLYTCVASSVAGNASRYFRVDVLLPPEVDGAFNNFNVTGTQNDEITLTCETDPDIPATITWYHNQRRLIAFDQGRVISDDGSTLTIQSAQRDDRGQYHCEVTNQAGSQSKYYTVEINIPGHTMSGDTDMSVVVGSLVTMECRGYGDPPPTILWTKDGDEISSASSRYTLLDDGTLVIPSVEASDAGLYECTVSNVAGQSSRVVTIEVQVPPRIISSNSKITATINSSTEIPCVTEGIPKPMIMWRKDREILDMTDGYAILDSGVLRIESIELGDSGLYSCVAKNEAGSDIMEIIVEVQVPPEVISYNLIFTVEEDSSVFMECEATGIPEPTVTWYFGDMQLFSSSFQYNILSSGALEVPIVRRQDRGEYRCIASNAAGEDEGIRFVDVTVPPTILRPPNTVAIANVSSELTLRCDVDGIPPPTILWLKNGETIRSEPRMTFVDNGSLVIENVQSSDAGVYTCVATSQEGRDSIQIEVSVHVPPRITSSPYDMEVMNGDRLELTCEASGYPPPEFTWYLNRTEIASPPTINGRSTLVRDNVMKDDSGTYMCVAENVVDQQRRIFTVTVRSPPQILQPPAPVSALQGTMTEMRCSTEGDPAPEIRWYQNGIPVQLDERKRVSENGSLIIYNTLPQDTGSYRCQVFNIYGHQESVTADLRIDSPPSFEIVPEDTIVDKGDNVLLDCQVTGDPTPIVKWTKDNFRVHTATGINIFMNNSLLIVGARLQDSGVYICSAINQNGGEQVAATVTVRVHGGWSDWQTFGPCSTTCGPGVQSRPRFCNQPEPANGGIKCSGPEIDSRPCEVTMCPIDGGFSDWTPWSQCSVTCGSGEKFRSRECNNPIPQYGGAQCDGRRRSIATCTLQDCPVDGRWGRWYPWQPCSRACGEGIMQRVRRCDSPPASNGGQPCEGLDHEEMGCKLADCPVNGGFTEWTAWTTCSKSCGSGIKSRSRTCSNPPPAYGGANCNGTATERMVCMTDPCPIHGGWSPWGPWSLCTATCDGGYQQRYRSCTRPIPQYNGRTCPDNSNERRTCNTQPCSTDGGWGPWSRWGECSATCGESVMRRHRFCNNPSPRNGGMPCTGDSELFERCDVPDCIVGPRHVFATVVGTLNGVEFSDGIMRVNISNEQEGDTRIRARVENIPLAAGHALKVLLSILSPAYWTSAFEVQGAANGYSLTNGQYVTNQQVTFPSGERVNMVIQSSGVDDSGTLRVTILVNGNTPEFTERDEITFSEFSERYIQTGPGELYGSAAKILSVNNVILPLLWNATVSYDTGRSMPFLVQNVRNQGLRMNYHTAEESINYGLRVFVSKGDQSNRCPQGFSLDPSGPYCTDDNECLGSPCSHGCSNYPGGYVCTCPTGFMQSHDRCLDIDECQVNDGGCTPSQRCKNNYGSYRCLQGCPSGYQEAGPPSFACLDINECIRQRICSHQCRNTEGSYQCLCPPGFRLHNQHTCVDIDECRENSHTCSANQQCRNTNGHYNCYRPCQDGFAIAPNGSCADIDECRQNTHNCGPQQTCRNVYGGYACTCRRGFRIDKRRCLDKNECLLGQPCLAGVCINTEGDYRCICPQGMSRLSDGKSCVGSYHGLHTACEVGTVYSDEHGECIDINECERGRHGCQGLCHNTHGSYRCSCPQGLVRLDERRCADIDECALGIDRCAASDTCLNIYGSYRCEDLSCPPYYTRVSKWECHLDCRYNNPECVNLDQKIRYLAHNTTVGISRGRDLIELRLVRESDSSIHTNTYFEIIDQREAEEYCNCQVPFSVRNDANGKGVIYTTRALTTPRNYRIKVRARGYESHHQQDFQTTFVLFISVSAYTYT